MYVFQKKKESVSTIYVIVTPRNECSNRNSPKFIALCCKKTNSIELLELLLLFEVFEIQVELANLPDIFGCLTSVIWPFIHTAFPFGSCLYCANISPIKDG